MSQNLATAAMTAACHVMHEFALKSLGIMHVTHAIPCMHISHHAYHACMHVLVMHDMYMHALPCMPCVQHMHTCVFIMMYAMCAFMHVFRTSTYMSCMLTFSCLARDSLATKQTQHQRLVGLASTSLAQYMHITHMHVYGSSIQ